MKGIRHNKNKLELDYCPTSAIAAIALVLMKNSKKYGGEYPDNNWRSGMGVSTYINCCLRHINKFKDGEDIDEISKLPHIFHAICNLAMLIENLEIFPESDDRLVKLGIKSFGLEEFTKKYLKGES